MSPAPSLLTLFWPYRHASTFRQSRRHRCKPVTERSPLVLLPSCEISGGSGDYLRSRQSGDSMRLVHQDCNLMHLQPPVLYVAVPLRLSETSQQFPDIPPGTKSRRWAEGSGHGLPHDGSRSHRKETTRSCTRMGPSISSPLVCHFAVLRTRVSLHPQFHYVGGQCCTLLPLGIITPDTLPCPSLLVRVHAAVSRGSQHHLPEAQSPHPRPSFAPCSEWFWW